MREIKFRVWWSGRTKPATSHMIEWVELCAEHLPYGFFPLENDDEWTLMQFTGLTDKNGVDIYEGDIIETSKAKAQIRYSKYSGGVVAASLDDFNYYSNFPQPFIGRLGCEVIGNIYENPELLEPPKEVK